MNISIGELILQSEVALSGLGLTRSTLWQYGRAWSEFESFCAQEDVGEFTDDVVTSFLQVVAAEHRDGRIEDWKRKLLRKSVLVLSEVARTGSYQWALSPQVHPNDALDATFRPVQEQFEAWLGDQRLALATRSLYATVSRRVLAWLPRRGVADVRKLTGSDVSAAVVFLGESYRPGSMRTALSAVRVLCRFLEESGRCAGLSQAIPTFLSRRVTLPSVIPAEDIQALIDSPDVATRVGRRDRALLLLAARTGLRPVDMVALRWGDIDWKQGQITLTQHKTGTALTVPLLADVGEAIADYLLHGRPTGVADEHVFLRTRAPYVGLSPSYSLYDVAARAFARTETVAEKDIGHGFRVLRASLATRMLEDTTPLPVISGALGHRGIDSAKHYLAADDKGMRECCLDFAGIEPRGARS